MTPKELYEKYAGRKVVGEDVLGIVCGYDNDVECSSIGLVIALTEGDYGWQTSECPHTIVTHQNNDLGYYWIDEADILPEEK